jgi:hypothetical protein
MAQVRIIVRDGRNGRLGRDPAPVADATEPSGEILAVFDSDYRFEVGDSLTLPDGSVVTVIGFIEEVSEHSPVQVVTVGDLPEPR